MCWAVVAAAIAPATIASSVVFFAIPVAGHGCSTYWKLLLLLHCHFTVSVRITLAVASSLM